MGDVEYGWWNVRTIVRHFFGIHTLIPTERWQRKPDGEWQVIFTGRRCWRCDYRE